MQSETAFQHLLLTQMDCFMCKSICLPAIDASNYGEYPMNAPAPFWIINLIPIFCERTSGPVRLD